MRVAGMVSWQKFHEREFEILVNVKAVLLGRGLGKMVDKMDNVESMPTVLRGTVPLARTRTAVTDSV